MKDLCWCKNILYIKTSELQLLSKLHQSYRCWICWLLAAETLTVHALTHRHTHPALTQTRVQWYKVTGTAAHSTSAPRKLKEAPTSCLFFQYVEFNRWSNDNKKKITTQAIIDSSLIMTFDKQKNETTVFLTRIVSVWLYRPQPQGEFVK